MKPEVSRSMVVEDVVLFPIEMVKESGARLAKKKEGVDSLRNSYIGSAGGL